MSTSAELKDHAAGNICTMIPIWKMTSSSGIIAAYMQHTRPTSGRGFNLGGGVSTLFTFNGVIYTPSVVEASRPTHSIGLSPSNVECTGILDEIVTKDDINDGVWKDAPITFEYVNFLDLTMGSTGIIEGFTGKFDIQGVTFKVELRSKSAPLHQLIGDITSPIDRNSFPAGVDPASWTISRNVVSSTDRRNFVIDGTAKGDRYFRYGLADFTTGANADNPPMEIKDSVGNAIELQLPMQSAIAPGDVVSLLAGYDGTRDVARDTYADAIDLNSEPDLPGLKAVLSYPN